MGSSFPEGYSAACSLPVENLREAMLAAPDHAATFGTNPNTLTTMPAVEAYCVKCKAKREMKDAKQVEMANGRKAMKGTCPTCGTGMFKILGK